MLDSIDALKYLKDSISFPQVIIIDVAMPSIFTEQQFKMAFNHIQYHQKQTLAKFGWISLAGTFLCKNMTETFEPVCKQGKHFIRYTAVRR